MRDVVNWIYRIIDKHNDEVSKEYDKGMRVGINLVKELRKK
jgi:hypothetical protein